MFKEIENRAAAEAKSMFLMKNVLAFDSDAWSGSWEGLSAGLPGEPWELVIYRQGRCFVTSWALDRWQGR